jgi:sialate O-acetylesterase
MHELFSDHVVLQRGQPVRVWGRADAGEEVTVSLAGASQRTKADDSGRWSVALAAMSAGGPHTLEARASERAQRVEDVTVGDVWLCSGQSNMVLQVHRALDSRAEIANSRNDSIRMLTVPLASHATPQEQFAKPVAWRKAAPDTVPEFSAACLYFARELQKTVKVPMGLINAAWGGSKIQSWMSEPALREIEEYGPALEALALYANDPLAAHARWGAHWEEWWGGAVGARSAPWAMQEQGEWRDAPPALGFWEQWGVPELADHTGMLWYRATATLTRAQAAQAAALSLGFVDEVEQTWVNGRPVGALGKRTREERSAPATGPGPERTYLLPPGALKAGDNVVVVNVLDTYSTGGLHGPPESRVLRFADGTSAPLTHWRYQLAPTGVGSPPRAPWEALAGLSVIHNGMIAPLGAFGLRGVAWYQGESNTDEANRYQQLLARFMADWRAKFGAELPFLIVQLANYGAPPTAPGESSWAALREAQRTAVARDAHAGLAVTIDIGDRYDIHPANKQEVGRRLARAARRVVYGESLPPSGPVPVAAKREGVEVVVTFRDVTDGLAAYSASGPIGFELCGAAAGSCRYVEARIDGERVLLAPGDALAATRVRYCWADSPVCTLYDGARLPAVPFEIEVQ